MGNMYGVEGSRVMCGIVVMGNMFGIEGSWLICG